MARPHDKDPDYESPYALINYFNGYLGCVLVTTPPQHRSTDAVYIPRSSSQLFKPVYKYKNLCIKSILLNYRYPRFFRFSFGPLLPETFEEDIQIMREVLTTYVISFQFISCSSMVL